MQFRIFESIISKSVQSSKCNHGVIKTEMMGANGQVQDCENDDISNDLIKISILQQLFCTLFFTPSNLDCKTLVIQRDLKIKSENHLDKRWTIFKFELGMAGFAKSCWRWTLDTLEMLRQSSSNMFTFLFTSQSSKCNHGVIKIKQAISILE